MPFTAFSCTPEKVSHANKKIGGTRLTQSKPTKLIQLLTKIYKTAERECEVEVTFNHTAGKQTNAARSLLLDYLFDTKIGKARLIARRLQAVTTKRSGLGLLFLIAGSTGTNRKLVVSRFPADTGVLAEQDGDKLTVELIERVFLKSATSYKAATYTDSSRNVGFWNGRAVDKQASLPANVSGYWIREFLLSDFRTTSAAGTRRVANALRAAGADATFEEQTELVALGRLVRGLAGEQTSVTDLLRKFRVSKHTSARVLGQLPAHVVDDKFVFDEDEYDRHVPYRTDELDTGALLTATTASFENVFRVEEKDDGTMTYSTKGRVVNRKLRRRS